MEINKQNLIHYIMDYESGQLSDKKTIKLFQYLLDTGLAWTLQGHYGRATVRLLEMGLIHKNYGK